MSEGGHGWMWPRLLRAGGCGGGGGSSERRSGLLSLKAHFASICQEEEAVSSWTRVPVGGTVCLLFLLLALAQAQAQRALWCQGMGRAVSAPLSPRPLRRGDGWGLPLKCPVSSGSQEWTLRQP